MSMWRIYFEIYDFMVTLVPNRMLRKKIRRKELYDYRRKLNALKKTLPNGKEK